MAARGPAENAKLMLQRHEVSVADVEEISRPEIRRQVLFLNFEANLLGILITTRNIIDRHGEAMARLVFLGHVGKQVTRERRNAALARQVVAQKRYLADFRGFFQQLRASTAFGEMPNFYCP